MALVTSASPALPAIVRLRPWIDPVVEQCGFGPQSGYVEYCWLPVLGPTATWAYRRLGLLVLTDRTPEIDLADFSQSLGLGAGLGRRSKLAGALVRLVHFGVAECVGEELAIRRALAPLSSAQVNRLSPSARATHYRLTLPPAG